MRSILADIAQGGALDAPDPVRAAREAVLAHLRDLCETPRGSVLVAPDFGFDDATHIYYEYPRSEEEARERLEAAIRRYEPRLTGVSVALERADERVRPRVVPDLTLRYIISATLVVEGRRVPMQFTSTLRNDKLFEIR